VRLNLVGRKQKVILIMRKIGVIILFLVLVLLAATLFLFSSGIKGIEHVSPSDNVRIEELRLCGATPIPNSNAQKIRICGSLLSDKQSIPIRIYIYKMPDDILVVENPVEDRFPAGEFFREFDLPVATKNNSYKLIAYFYKKVVGELEFKINGP